MNPVAVTVPHPQGVSLHVRVYLSEDNTVATGVKKELDAGDARAHRHVARIDTLNIGALEEGIGFGVDGLTEIKARPRGQPGARAGRINAVWRTAGRPVVARTEDVTGLTHEHTAHRPACARRPAGGHLRHPERPLINC